MASDYELKYFEPEIVEFPVDLSIIIKKIQSPNFDDNYLLPLINEVNDKLIKTLKPKCGYVILKNDISITKANISVNNVTFESNHIITPKLKNSEWIVLFLVTIGRDIEDLIKKLLLEDDSLAGFIADILASEYTDSLACWIENNIRLFAKNHQKGISNRYSPGYCQWNVSEQKKLFSFFPESFCNVSLNESGLMKPIKSISGIIGVGADIKKVEYQCAICDRNDCVYRKD